MTAPSAARLIRVDFPVAHPASAEAFFTMLGFARSERGRDDFCAPAAYTEMRLGATAIRLVHYDQPGAPYPAERSSCDVFFQHIAIVAEDIAAAARRALTHPLAVPITANGPQRLPANAGSATAFKFRDPDGHPLELIAFAAQSGAQRSPFVGYDHSAICVSDRARSLDFYVGLLGLAAGAHSLNQGIEQARLDGLEAPIVDVDALLPTRAPRPHVELLHYRQPRPLARAPVALRDIAASQLVFEADDARGLAARLGAAGATFERPSLANGESLVRDPDGRLIRFAPSAPAARGAP